MKRHWGVAAGCLMLAAMAAGSVPAEAQVVRPEVTEVGDRRVSIRWDRTPGDTLDVRARRECKSDCEAFEPDTARVNACKRACEVRRFGGYHVWRSTAEDTSQMVLLRTYSVFDSTWTFTGNERVFTDPDSVIVRACEEPLPDPDCNPAEGGAVAPFNGFPYYYAVTWFESTRRTVAGAERILEFPMQTTSQGRLTEPVQPASPSVTTGSLLGRVLVVPNPFNPRDPFRRASFGQDNRVQFVNLPSPATVRIFTSAGDLVQILENTDSDDSLNWDLKNGNGEDIVGGIYMFVVETPSQAQSRSGHFVIIR